MSHGDASAEVVYHEYCHGITNRLANNGFGLRARSSPRAMGEGWADWYAKDFLVEDGREGRQPARQGLLRRLREYVIQNFPEPGIRRQAMDCKVAAVSAHCPAYGTTGTGGFTYGDSARSGGYPESTTTARSGRRRSGTCASGSARDNGLAVCRRGPAPLAVHPSFLDMRDAILQEARVLGMPRGRSGRSSPSAAWASAPRLPAPPRSRPWRPSMFRPGWRGPPRRSPIRRRSATVTTPPSRARRSGSPTPCRTPSRKRRPTSRGT